MSIVNVQPLLQDSQRAVLLDLLVQPLQQQALPVRAILQFRQFLGLGGFEELPEEFAVEGKLSVEVSRIANAVAVLGEGVFDVRFERCFVAMRLRRGKRMSAEVSMRCYAGLGVLALLLHSWVEFNMRIPALAICGAFLLGTFLKPLPKAAHH